MAGLTKTYTGDLTQAIAGKLWGEIKDRLDGDGDGKPSKKVRQAARELKKDDPDATKVQDKSLRETVLKIFGPIDAKLIATERKADNISGKVSAVTASLVDTQNLIINQNQILEDKFDTILQILNKGEESKEKREEDAKFSQLELFDDLREDLDKSTAISKGRSRKRNPLVDFIFSRLDNIGREWALKTLKRAWRSKALKRVRVPIRMLERRASQELTKTLVDKGVRKKTSGMLLEKLLKKGGARMIPAVSTVMAADDVDRYRKQGDFLGMGLAFIDMVASGAEGAYATGAGAPIGLAASVVANIAGWGLTGYELFQIFGLGKDPYSTSGFTGWERGNVNLTPKATTNMTNSISEILGITKAVMDSSGFGSEYNTLTSEAGLGSFSPNSVNVVSDIGGTGGSSSSVNSITEMASERSLDLKEKKKEPECPDGMKWDQEAHKCMPMDPNKPEGIKRNIGGLVDFATFGFTDFDQRGDLIKKGEKTDEHDDRNIFQKTGDFLDPRNWFNKWGKGNKKGEGGPDTKPNTQRPIVGRVGNTGNSTGPHVHIQRFPPPTSYEKDHITKDHPVIDHIFVGGKSLSDWDMTSPASPDRWGRPHYGPDYGGLGINNQPITFSDQVTFDPETLYQRSSGGEGNNILFEYNGEQFTIFHLNSGPEGDLAAPKRKDDNLSADKLSSPIDSSSLSRRSSIVSRKSEDREVDRKQIIRNSATLIVNNIIVEESTQRSIPTKKSSSIDFINAYNLAKHTV